MNEYGEWINIGSDMAGFIALCGVLGKLHEINMSDCGLGAVSAGELAKAVSDAEAALAHLAICQNKIGSEGGTALVEAIKTSNLEYISIGKDLTLPIKGELDSPTLDASDQDIDPGYVMNGVLAGLVGITSPCAVVSPAGAVIVGALAAACTGGT